MNKKDKKIIEDAEKQGIPIFVLTAKDKLTPEAIKSYYQACFAANCPPEHCSEIIDRIVEFQEWQLNNRDLVKLPD